MLMDDIDFFEIPHNSHGGARPGSGAKKAGYVKSKEIVDFDKARARNEAAKADQNELDYKIKSGEYVSRDVVKQVSAQAAASIAQTLRSIPDNLERKGIEPKVCLQISEVIDEALNDLADEFAMMTPEIIL